MDLCPSLAVYPRKHLPHLWLPADWERGLPLLPWLLGERLEPGGHWVPGGVWVPGAGSGSGRLLGSERACTTKFEPREHSETGLCENHL